MWVGSKFACAQKVWAGDNEVKKQSIVEGCKCESMSESECNHMNASS